MDCFKSTGKDITETRYPGEFLSIEAYSKIDVSVIQGNEYKVEVIAGKNMHKNIKTYLNNDVLIIDNLNTCNFVRGYKRGIQVNVTVPTIQKISNHGVATIKIAENFQQDTLVVRVENSGDIHINGVYHQIRTSTHGNGDIFLSGKCNSFFVYTNGTNYVHAEELIVRDYAFIHTLTLGDCIVNAAGLKKLECNIQSDGNVVYIGAPDAITDYSDGKARGKLIRQDD